MLSKARCAGEQWVETWLVQEPCAMGTLAQAIHKGQLRVPGAGGRKPDILAVMATAGTPPFSACLVACAL